MFTHIELPKIKRPFVRMLDTVDGHYYETNTGEVYPSITTVLQVNSKDGIDAWKSRIGYVEANRISKSSMAVGTKLHELIEQYLKNEPPLIDFDPDIYEKSPVELFNVTKPLLDKHVNNIYALETKLFSHELKLAGTVDCVAEYDGKLSIIDFKNSRKPKTPSRCKNYFQQGFGYKKMWNECYNMNIDQVVIIVVSWDNKVRPFIVNANDYESALWDTLIKYEAKT